jgi:hypothetical protein
VELNHNTAWGGKVADVVTADVWADLFRSDIEGIKARLSGRGQKRVSTPDLDKKIRINIGKSLSKLVASLGNSCARRSHEVAITTFAVVRIKHSPPSPALLNNL